MLALVVESRPHKLKYVLFSAKGDDAEVLVEGEISDIAREVPQHSYRYGSRGRGEGATIAGNHWEALSRIASVLASRTTGDEDYSQNLGVVAHRVPHGGQKFRMPAIVTEEVLELIESFSPFAPLGNPAALEGIRAALNTFPLVPHVAVFDTAFHQSMPPEAYLYALPYELYELRGLRRFGFHSIAHRHAIGMASAEFGTFPESIRVLSVYIGEETSASAFSQGKCVDTTSGLTAQVGLPGGTNAGCIDPAAVSYLLRTEGFSPDEMDSLLSSGSGVAGLSGFSTQLTEIVEEAAKGDERCQQAFDVFVHQLTRALGGLIAVMGGVDLFIFTGSQGAQCPRLRAEICTRLEFLGLALDSHRNDSICKRKEHEINKNASEISRSTSPIKVYVVPDNDELKIAMDSIALVNDIDAS